MKYILAQSLVLLFLIVSCNNKTEQVPFDPETVKPVILKLVDKWNEGTKKRDISIISSIYDDNAHYVPDQRATRHRKQEITELWKNDLMVIREVKLNMETLEGTKEILYETGTGYSYIVNPNDTLKLDTFQYKYVNVWKLQLDGTYKCVIDTYNEPEAKH